MCRGLSWHFLTPIPALFHEENQLKLTEKGTEVRVVEECLRGHPLPIVPSKRVKLMLSCPSWLLHFVEGGSGHNVRVLFFTCSLPAQWLEYLSVSLPCERIPPPILAHPHHCISLPKYSSPPTPHLLPFTHGILLEIARVGQTAMNQKWGQSVFQG